MGVSVCLSGEAGDNERDLRSLLDWLRRERIRGVTVRAAETRPAEGEMGAISEALTVLGPSGAGAAIGGALMAWLRTRRPSLQLVVQGADGARYELTTSATADSEAALTRFLDAALPVDRRPESGSTRSPQG